MSNLRQIIRVSFVLLIALTATACGLTPPTEEIPTETPTPENTPLPPIPGAVDVGGYYVYYKCFGEGTPTVIVETGEADKPTLSNSWNAVIQAVSPITRICIHDRVNNVRTSQQVAENLHILLSKIPVPGPYNLVAHSIGSYHARVFAHLYPEEVAGMVLVEPTLTFPDSIIAFATAYPTYSPYEEAGITSGRLSEDDIYISKPSSVDGLDMDTSSQQVIQAGSLGDIPLVVINKTPSPEEFVRQDPATQEQYAAILGKLYADLATLSSRGVFISAQTYDQYHSVPLAQPQPVIDAITSMLEEIHPTTPNSPQTLP
jgi:hypothetical protein